MNSSNDFARLPRPYSAEERSDQKRKEKDKISTKKLPFPPSFQMTLSTIKLGLTEGIKCLGEIATPLQVKCTHFGRQILLSELAAFRNGKLSYDEFKQRNGTSLLLFTEGEKEQFRNKVLEILGQTKPGLVKALDMFGDRMCHLMGIGESQIAAAIIPHEIEALRFGKMDYLDFRNRNTYYVFENMTESELEVARYAFLKMGAQAYDDQNFEMDREILLS